MVVFVGGRAAMEEGSESVLRARGWDNDPTVIIAFSALLTQGVFLTSTYWILPSPDTTTPCSGCYRVPSL